MISVMTLILQFSCVGNSELEAERDELAAKVTELETSVERLEAEKKAQEMEVAIAEFRSKFGELLA